MRRGARKFGVTTRREFLKKAGTVAGFVGLGGISMLGRALAADGQFRHLTGSTCQGTNQYIELPCRLGATTFGVPGDQYCLAGRRVECMSAYTCNGAGQRYECDNDYFTCNTGTLYGFTCNTSFECTADGSHFTCSITPVDNFNCSGWGVYHTCP